MTYVEINLNPAECNSAAGHGIKRTLDAIGRGAQNHHGMTGHGWTEGIEGAAAELAVSKYLGVYWCGGGMYKNPDVAGNLQVRWASSHHYQLIVRPLDPDEDYYVFVTGEMPNYRLHGFIKGSDAKREDRLDAPNGRPPAYFAPSKELLSIDKLSWYVKPEATHG
jgi:hypothetical protein